MKLSVRMMMLALAAAFAFSTPVDAQSKDIDLYLNGSRFGEIRSNGDIFKDGRNIGMVRNMVNPKWAAMIYFFDFFSF